MDATLADGAFLWFWRRRFRVFTVRLRRHVQEPPHNTLDALRGLPWTILIVLGTLSLHQVLYGPKP
jgi:hypothetical protein